MEYTNNIIIYDPWASKEHVKKEYDIEITNELPDGSFDAVILAVAHKEFLEMDVKAMLNAGGVVYDVKGLLPRNIIDDRL